MNKNTIKIVIKFVLYIFLTILLVVVLNRLVIKTDLCGCVSCPRLSFCTCICSSIFGFKLNNFAEISLRFVFPIILGLSLAILDFRKYIRKIK